MQHRYHFIYKTTCTVTGDYYVGMHSTNDLDDRYVGSGRNIRASIRDHGRENHVFEALEWCQTREELAERESQVVNQEMLADPRCLNIHQGGNTAHHEYKRSKASARRQARSLRAFFTRPGNREHISQAVNAAYKRADVRARVAKKLREADVIEIRRFYEHGMSFSDIAQLFGVSGNTVWHIVTRKTWKNVA